MKKILVLSVLLNAVLAALIAHELRVRSSDGALPQARPPAVTSPVAALPRPATRGQVITNQAGWAWIESRDLGRLVANLRAVGCPEQTIQDIACLRLCREYRQKLLARTAALEQSIPYWRAVPPDHGRDERNVRQEINEEINTGLEALFGGNGQAIRMRVAGLSEDWLPAPYLTEEKSRLVRAIGRHYQQLGSELSDPASVPFGYADPQAREQILELARQKTAELRQALTPDEYQLYLLHDSPAAQYVRSRLPEAKSEDEYRVMVRVAAECGMDPALISAQLRYGVPDEEKDPSEMEREQAFQKRLVDALGEDRLAAQKRDGEERERNEREEQSRRESIKQVTEIGATVEEAGAFIDRLKAMQPALEQRAKEMNADGSPEQRKAFEQFLKGELERAAGEIMGPDKAKALVRKLDREQGGH